MSLAPHAAYLRDGKKLGDVEMIDTMIKDGLWDAFQRLSHGNYSRKCCLKISSD